MTLPFLPRWLEVTPLRGNKQTNKFQKVFLQGQDLKNSNLEAQTIMAPKEGAVVRHAVREGQSATLLTRPNFLIPPKNSWAYNKTQMQKTYQ